MKTTVILSLVAVIFVMACNNVIHEKNNVLGHFTEKPITVAWNGSTEEWCRAYQANVQAFTMNNRQDAYAGLNDSYRLAMMVIDDRILTRFDFDELNSNSVTPEVLWQPAVTPRPNRLCTATPSLPAHSAC